ncbi:MAG: signal recognition particle-docking protein FtsY [Acidimicrobiaceae bacterium]|nr:signal recognition particle-docking protein FtsY [Acidimicrobiaceae bacterium]
MHVVLLVFVYLIAVAIVATGGVLIARQRSARVRVGKGIGVDSIAEPSGSSVPPPAETALEETPVPLSSGMARTRGVVGAALARMRLRGGLDEAFWSEMEETLLLADLGLVITSELVAETRQKYRMTGLNSSVEAIELLRATMLSTMMDVDRTLNLDGDPPSVILLIGVNGAGKTTTIGKLAKYFADEGRAVVLAAGDTFRAAASDQLDTWASRAGVEIVKGAPGGDPAAVVFDAASKASAKGAQIVIADTAGRLQTSSNLMEELKKIRRVTDRAPGTLTEVLLVIDATTGQNGLVQAKSFTEAAGTTGVVLTKLDGSAKGGVAYAIEKELGIPIKFVGTGEGIADLVPFDPVTYVDEICGFGS